MKAEKPFDLTAAPRLSRALRKMLSGSAVFGGLIVILSVFPLLSAQAANPSSSLPACQPFVQVNENAFGLGGGADGTFRSEEGFEVLVFNGQLYLGMEADNTMGARIWRTKAGVTLPTSQADWEEVAADPQGYPFGVTNVAQNDHIDSLAEFNGYLYASTANGGSSTYGTRVFRSSTGNPHSWEDALVNIGAGFGSVQNTNFKDMQVFNGWLCGGTQNWLLGAQVWCTQDGLNWVQKNLSGFGVAQHDNRTVAVWSGFVYRDALYFGVQNLGATRSSSYDDLGKLYRTRNLNGTPQWEEVFVSLPGYLNRVDILGELDGSLYIASRGSSGGIIVYRSPNGDRGTWQQVSLEGMNGTLANHAVVVDGAVAYEGGLYVAVSNNSGFQLWRTSGTLQGNGMVDWEQVGGSGLTEVQNVHSELVVFNGHLFAWTSNYVHGQQVLRSNCAAGAGLPSPTPTNTAQSSATPTLLPTATATAQSSPTTQPSPTPTLRSTETPTVQPTATPTAQPSPTLAPSQTPSDTPAPSCPQGDQSCLNPSPNSKTYSVFLPILAKP
ncbi:MAG: PT domain-containing protein [Anaerolineales bacterium]|nr:PT domain-containing protein [Anaerolineales bacterium]MDW8447470.1 PT domain-containing protein [Anaerolineales bacterium]